ncbi:hypothetical protein, partial [Paenibacillus humicus]|uniref:hypothetical protein n=1 Tax=Paenibacillus humicus TaxID=412861 RepID=UPI001C3F9A8C
VQGADEGAWGDAEGKFRVFFISVQASALLRIAVQEGTAVYESAGSPSISTIILPVQTSRPGDT